MRHAPIEGVVLTDAELDHTLGLVLLREATELQVAATPAVHADPGGRLARCCAVTRAFADVRAATSWRSTAASSLSYRDGRRAG